MANSLKGHARERNVVMYLAAPGASGKTSSILPAFLRSGEKDTSGFTHYVYLAFDITTTNC